MKIIERLNTTVNCCELIEAYQQNEGLKDRIIHVNTFEGENPKLEFGVVDDWDSTDNVELDSILGSLLGYSTLTKIKRKYDDHRKEGIGYYDDIRAGLAYEYSVYIASGGSDGLSIEDISHLEGLWENCIGKLIRGDWMTCKISFELIPTDNVFTQELKYKHLFVMSNYILEHYG